DLTALTRDIERVGYHVTELRVVADHGQRIAGFGTNVFRELANRRYVTIGRAELSRLLFETVRRTSEVMFDNEIVGLETSRVQRKIFTAANATQQTTDCQTTVTIAS